MNAAPLNLASPIGQRLLAWINERFPFANALLFFILYLATAVVARAAFEDSINLSMTDLMGCLVTWSFFLLLRVFDEHKDYALDCLNHPQRVLQSGLITLNHLKTLAAFALALQLGWSLWLDGGLGQTTVAWLLMFGWTCLMGKEFFVADWLNRHLTWYAVSHMLVMPLIVWWLANMAVPGLDFSPALGILMALAFVSGFCFEITRKTKGPEEERDTVESYSRIFGTRPAALLVMVLITTMVVIQFWLINNLTDRWPFWALIILTAFWVLGLHQLKQFLQQPSAKSRGKNEAVVALTMLAGYAVLIAAVLADQGIALTLF